MTRSSERIGWTDVRVAARESGSAPPAIGRREQKRLSTRRELLLAARKWFSQEGLHDSRVEDITEQAGIAKGTLYLYFRNKEDLVKAVVSDGFASLRTHIETRLTGQRSLERAAAAAFSAHVEFFAENPDLMRIFHQVRGVLQFDRPRWRPLRTELLQHVDFLAQQLAVGEARSWTLPRRRDLAVFLFGCASGSTSVLVATYPRTARLRSWEARWSERIGRAVAEAGAMAPRRPGPKRPRALR
jgi:AcrR family transcriptional regulator